MRLASILAAGLLAGNLAGLAAMPAAAQEDDPVFDSYDAMRAEMDGLMMARDMQALMLRFGGGDEMTGAQLDNLDAQVEQLYRQDFENAAVLRRATLQNGFVQELIAYWTGLSYVYAYVFFHEIDGRVVSINYRFNSDFATLNQLF